MAKQMMGQFDDLIKYAAKFVETQKGAWDHTAWVDFLADTEKKGYEMTNELKSYLGTTLESMRKFYTASSSTESIAASLKSISDDSVKFIKKTNGMWNHSEWESFLGEIQKKGISLSEETMRYTGNILESVKSLYAMPSFMSDKFSESSKSSGMSKSNEAPQSSELSKSK
jgi:superoxide dismutase